MDAAEAMVKTMNKITETLAEGNVIEKKPIKLLVGIPTVGISYEFFTSWNAFWTDLVRSAKFEVGCQFKYRMAPFLAQEQLAREAVDSGATHLLLIDDDIFDFTLLNLITLLEADVDMVGGVMLTKKFPFHTCAMRRLDPKKPLLEHAQNMTGFDMYEVPKPDQKGLKPVDLISFGFTLFKTDLFKKLDKPYFIPDAREIDLDSCHYRYLNFTDSIFCDKLHYRGIQPYAHFDVWLNHNGVTKDNVGSWLQIYQTAGHLTQPGIKMNNNDFVKYKMVVKEKMVEAERRFESEAINKLKYYKEKA